MCGVTKITMANLSLKSKHARFYYSFTELAQFGYCGFGEPLHGDKMPAMLIRIFLLV